VDPAGPGCSRLPTNARGRNIIVFQRNRCPRNRPGSACDGDRRGSRRRGGRSQALSRTTPPSGRRLRFRISAAQSSQPPTSFTPDQLFASLVDQHGFVLQTRIGLRSRNQFVVDGECDAQDVSPDHSFYQLPQRENLATKGGRAKARSAIFSCRPADQPDPSRPGSPARSPAGRRCGRA
jgi:hypothetical protein